MSSALLVDSCSRLGSVRMTLISEDVALGNRKVKEQFRVIKSADKAFSRNSKRSRLSAS
ncbi:MULTISPECIES: hypothetical protein [Vibrio]|uniref:hypothetical protein n=1 Tax=Vibrio TaxID=662 RepID=UPI0013A6753E|nr:MULTISPECIES: hypothetical protein [Vibrio]